MALNKEQLSAEIKGILDDMLTRTQNSNEEFANRLANAIDNYVKGADGKYISGTLVAGSTPVTSIATVNVKLH
ncbi:MAG: hypothetical protein N2747_00435 [Chitinophagaceae bacterium]|nr:hypothetical protein [Chitinophagaceae bacterium]